MQKECDTSIEKVGCSTTGYQDVDVCIPVTIRPFGEVGNVKTRCEGSPSIIRGCDHCPGKPGQVCKFTISQRLRVEIPVVFGAKAEIGETSVECGCTESSSLCEPSSDFETGYEEEYVAAGEDTAL